MKSDKVSFFCLITHQNSQMILSRTCRLRRCKASLTETDEYSTNLHVPRKLSEKRIFPAMDLNKSGTRKEDLLMSQEEMEAIWTMRRELGNRPTQEVTETIIDNLAHTRNNENFIQVIKKIFM